MKKLVYVIVLTLFFSCQENTEKPLLTIENEINQVEDSKTTNITQYEEQAMLDKFIVVVDTNTDVQALYSHMPKLENDFNLKKDSISVQHIKSGESFYNTSLPRRYDGRFISLEYFKFYKNHTDTSTLALVAGVFSDSTEAYSLLDSLLSFDTTAFIVKTKLNMGCMH